MNIQHPLNINQKYNNLFTLIPDRYTGVGIKITNQYESKLSKEQWVQKQQEFWGILYNQQETRTEHSEKIWSTIQAAVKVDEAKCILNAAGLTLMNNSMQMIIDQSGNKYEVPVFCLNEPISFPQKADQRLVQNFSITPIHFKARCKKWEEDMIFEYQTNTSVQTLKEAISVAHQTQNVRIFFNGREMQNNHEIGNYGIIDDSVLQVLQNN